MLLLIAALFARAPHPQVPQDTTPVTLSWTGLSAAGIRLRATGITTIDSARPTIATEEHVFALHSNGCQPLPEAACTVGVRVEVDRYGIGRDSVTATAGMRDLGGGSRSQVLLTSAGTWESTADSSSNYASGFVVEQLAAWLPLVLPQGPVYPGASWPVHLFSRRPNRRVGTLQDEFTGRATLDSLTGGPEPTYAWLSETGTQVGHAGNSVGTTTLRSTIRWSLREGTPDSAVTLTEGTFDAGPNEFSSTRQLRVIRTRYDIRRLPSDSAQAVP